MCWLLCSRDAFILNAMHEHVMTRMTFMKVTQAYKLYPDDLVVKFNSVQIIFIHVVVTDKAAVKNSGFHK